MKITELLQDIGAPIAFFPDLVPIAGSHHAAIFLCQLIYWHGKQSNPEGWIYKTQEQWSLETELTDEQQKNARNVLVSRGLIQERHIGLPRRLEYRFQENFFNQLWDCWQVACKIKKEFKDHLDQFGIIVSRGFGADDIKLKLENYRKSFHQCQQIALGFFEKCKKAAVSPITKVNELAQVLKRVAETLEKSIIRQTRIIVSEDAGNKNPGLPETSIQGCRKQASEDAGNKNLGLPETSIRVCRKQESEDGGNKHPRNPDLPGSVIIDVQAFQAPSESTAETTAETTSKTTSKITAESVLPHTHTQAGFKGLKNGEDQDAGEQGLELQQDPQGEQKVKLQKDPQEIPRPEKEYRAEPTIPHEDKFSAAAAAPNFEETPQWVVELEEKVRRGMPIKREKLIALANYRLGDLIGLYRHSGEIFNPAIGDISEDFVKFVQWYSFKGNPDVAYVLASILKFEKEPENWPMLQTWVREWQSVIANSDSFKDMMSNRVASLGKKASGRDFEIVNDLALREAFGL
ncbi:hypothetical protein NIES2100_79810 (plasmid) [Calothrix sp. NIES-2100]|uniref:hypothetical protein n=1 Tax=Calothrix sp. NIES-2100 TaxID=1954172 RepID=UPI000B5F132A|nr:hypothetical protein NIES2100_79810 [Calothrix sp. NIES-2100]